MAPPDLPKKVPSEHSEANGAISIEKSPIKTQHDALLEGHEWKLVRHVLFPSILVLMCPPSLLWLIHLIVDLNGDLARFATELVEQGLLRSIWAVWQPMSAAVGLLFAFTFPLCMSLFFAWKNKAWRMVTIVFWVALSAYVWGNFQGQIMPILNVISHSKDSSVYMLILGFSAFELALLLLMPGTKFLGPVTPKNNRPNYIENGLSCFFVTLAAFAAFTTPSSPLYFFSASIVYDNFTEVIAACNVLSLTLCLLLNIKGLVAPTNSDVLNEQNLIMSFYWGRELHPEIADVSVKQFTNCRFGMMGWPCIILSFAAAQYERNGYVTDAMAVNVALQLIYIAKFFHWESGYFATMDMQEDRAGFYICWGCISWLPCLYTSSTLCIVKQTAMLGPILAGAIMCVGCACIFFNYAADAERKLVRETKGNCLVWGAKPEVIWAKYTTADGVEHSSILLVSGFWGISRHSHYLFELSAAFAWSVPGSIIWFTASGGATIVPMAYLIFLTILLVDRSSRDDKRCMAKYGPYWEKYRSLVPYKILPGVY